MVINLPTFRAWFLFDISSPSFYYDCCCLWKSTTKNRSKKTISWEKRSIYIWRCNRLFAGQLYASYYQAGKWRRSRRFRRRRYDGAWGPRSTINDDISDIAKAKEQLSKASERIKQIEEELKEKETAHNEELKKKLEELTEQMNGLTDEIDDLKDKVKKLEGKLENLEAKRKREFEGIYSAIRELENKDQLQFSGEINTESISALMRYYKYLSVYDSVLSGTIDSAAKLGCH